MAGYSDRGLYPRSVFSTAALDTTAQDVGTASVERRVAWGTITGGAAAEIVIFRDSAGSTEYFRQPVPIGAVIPLGGFFAKDGLEVLTASAAGDVGLVLAYE